MSSPNTPRRPWLPVRRNGTVIAMTEVKSPPTTGIQLAGVRKSFRTPQGPVHAVRGVDISIAPGETVALLGPNGAGKSTTIDMMLGLLPPDAGEVSVFGRTPSAAVAHGDVG